MATEVGHIAELLHTATSDETPLQKRLDLVARRLLWACLGIVVLVFALGWFRSIAPFEMLLTLVVIPALYVIWIWQTDVKQRSVGEKRGTGHALPLQSS